MDQVDSILSSNFAMSRIKLLSDELINQIAAGEIVERPASALKEVVENAIDAEASIIDVFVQDGGKSKMVVQDDGLGLSKDDLSMAIQRHATSKLSNSNLFDIRSYGFRGEAIPSIAAISDFSIESNGFGLSVNFSEKSEIVPSQIENGTRVTIRDLFARIPARLKFLKSENTELTNCLTVMENFALTKPDVNFSLRNEEKNMLLFQNNSMDSRISTILGDSIFKQSVFFDEKDDSIRVFGYLFHPMDSSYSQQHQRIFVNNRFVKDKTISSSIRNAYKDLIPAGRFAIVVIFIEIDPFHIDINVSPTKSEIRFRDVASVRKFLTNAIRKNVSKFDRVIMDFKIPRISNFDDRINEKKVAIPQGVSGHDNELRNSPSEDDSMSLKKDFEEKVCEALISSDLSVIEFSKSNHFFGEPIAQIFDSYILTRTEDGIMIIDQHAVHEKITQEKMIRNLKSDNKQFLLSPEIIELTNIEINVTKAILLPLEECGFSVDLIQSSLIISAIPSILNIEESIDFIKNVISENDFTENLKTIDFIKHKIADKACHNSIRFGRKLSHDEMISLIEQMEETTTIHQCNHHRPSFVELSKNQLEKMFRR
ncbi:MAG: DNA mismatch repair endonuclease MutL [Holosporales bacterium]|jgi:DNA mismatch repair protein MutL|nr:DNA mismatch repair endonuclease MutL [Holosporales bacterium]